MPSACPKIFTHFPLAFALIVGTSCLATAGPLETAPRLPATEPGLPPISAAAALVLDRDSGVVLGVKNPDVQRAMASTTKMMTALLALEHNGSQLDALVGPISAHAASLPGTSMNLNEGDWVSLRDLLYGLLLPSGNDAAVAIAEWVGGDEASFVALMNQRAQELGLSNTAYRSPHGLDPAEFGASCDPPFAGQTNCGHYSSARDLVTLARFALSEQPVFVQIVRTASWTPTTWVDRDGNPRIEELENDNLLLSSIPYPGANGVKTGNTPNAGYCMVAGATQWGHAVLSVVLGCSANDVRHNESIQLLDYGFEQLVGENLCSNGSFEEGQAGWEVSGNQDVISFGATHGVKAARFNAGQSVPNAVLAQSFATVAGQTYALSFDYGVYSPMGEKEQRVQVSVQGNGLLLSQLIVQTGSGDQVQHTSHNYSFVADSALSTLTFHDVSTTSDSVDSFIDNIWIIQGSAPALQLTTAVSRKTHGAAGVFDVNLPMTGSPGVECRNGGGNHTLVFTFTNNVISGSASVTTGIGTVSGNPIFSGNTMTVNLTGVADVQKITVTLNNVTDSFAQVLSGSAVSVNVLLGDTSGNKVVNSSDIAQTKAQSGLAANAGNFREDVVTNGVINSSDIAIVKSRSGAGLP